MLKKIIAVVFILFLVVITPWLDQFLRENFPIRLILGHRVLFLYLTNILIASIVGYVIMKSQITLWILIIVSMFVGLSSIYWKVNRFEQTKAEVLSGEWRYPPNEIECFKEINYTDFWDYAKNGCHYSMEEVYRSILTRLLIWTITILVIRIIFNFLKIRSPRKNPNLLDD